jgi:hypothetical protein
MHNLKLDFKNLFSIASPRRIHEKIKPKEDKPGMWLSMDSSLDSVVVV